MTDENSRVLATTIANSYIDPLVAALEAFEGLPLNTSGDRNAACSSRENAFAAAACLLMAITLESLIKRVWYLQGAKKGPNGAVEHFAVVTGSDDFAVELEECFLLRDVLAHSHVLEVKIRWDEDTPTHLDLSTPMKELAGDFGKRQYGSRCDKATRRTQCLDLYLLPTFVGLHEVRQLARVFLSAAVKLELAHHKVKILADTVRYRGEQMPFSDVLERFADGSEVS